MDDLKRRFGENVARLRRRAGISAEELGFRCDMHRTYIGRLERGGSEPRLGTVVRLIAALGATPEEILDGISWRPGGGEFR